MYCFPYPKASDVDPIQVPYIAHDIYSISGPYTFDTFYKVVISRDPSLRNSLASSTQSWLFFGLASEALGRDIPHNEFIERRAVHTSDATIDLRIPAWFGFELKTRWDNLKNTLSMKRYAVKRRELQRYYKLAQLAVNSLDLAEDQRDMDLALIVLSVHMLLFMIKDLLGSVELAQTSLPCMSTKVLTRRMRKNGWCRKRLNVIEAVPISYPSLYFISSFRPPQYLNEDHQPCTVAKCCVTVDLAHPSHRTPDCQCQNIYVPLEQVTRIIARGGIPLIRITYSPSERFRVEVVPYQRTSLFTAVSHVWADRQLGSTKNALPQCQVEYLESILATSSPQSQPWRLKDWLSRRFYSSNSMDAVESPSRSSQLFWLDTFCIPQDPQHTELKQKAINSMNLIYAAASHTLVFDAGLQKFDAGRGPSSQVSNGRPAVCGPTTENFLDVLAHFCASNWMGRAWTLQEGILSRDLAFPLNGSLAYLRLLCPKWTPRSNWPFLRKLKQYFKVKPVTKSPDAPLTLVDIEAEPFRKLIHGDLHRFANALLNAEEYRNYAQESVDRSARFVKSHRLLQSRSTTQPEDLSLILINMSGMNGNSVSQSLSADERMKLFFYGLETIPIELLYSKSERIGGCQVDSWIPREIVPEIFSRESIIKLGSEGFTFHHHGSNPRPRLFLLPSGTIWHNEVLLSLPGKRDNKMIKCLLTTLTPGANQSFATPNNGWCVLLEDERFDSRGARFVVSRIDGNKVFLHFDCPLRVLLCNNKTPEITEELLRNECMTQEPDSQQEFIIEKSATPLFLGMSRPQNPEQYYKQLQGIIDSLDFGVSSLERYLMEIYLSDAVLKSPIFYTGSFLFYFQQRQWINEAAHAFVHDAWVETYQPTWNSTGRWKWFWKLWNYLPIPIKIIERFWCHYLLFRSMHRNEYYRLLIVSMQLVRHFSFSEIANMYLIGFGWKILSALLRFILVLLE